MKTYLEWKKDHYKIYEWSKEITAEIHDKSEAYWKVFEELSKNDDFLYEAFKYELANHEACYDYSFDVLEFFWLRPEPRLIWIANRARKDYLRNCDF